MWGIGATATVNLAPLKTIVTFYITNKHGRVSFWKYYVMFFCRLTDRPTDQKSHILNSHSNSEFSQKKYQPSILNISKDIHFFPIPFLRIGKTFQILKNTN